MHDVQAVLSLPREAMYLALGDYLAARVDAVGLGELSTVERVLWLTREFHWAVREGGLLGYMAVKTSRPANDTEAALQVIGAVDVADALRDAIAERDQLTDAFYEACPWR